MSLKRKVHLLWMFIAVLFIVISFGHYPWWVNSQHPMIPRLAWSVVFVIELVGAVQKGARCEDQTPA